MNTETLLLEAEIRDTKIAPSAIRLEKKIPAVFYGKKVESSALSLDYKSFRKVFISAGESTLIDLKFGGKTYKVLIHDIQFEPITDKITHVDFINVSMDEMIDADVKFEFVGVSPAVKDLGGGLSTQKQSLKVRCLPKDLPHTIQIDLSVLVAFHDAVHVKDLVLPEGVKVLDDVGLSIVTVVPPRKEEEEVKPVPTAAEVTGVAAVEAAAAAEAEAKAKQKEKDKK